MVEWIMWTNGGINLCPQLVKTSGIGFLSNINILIKGTALTQESGVENIIAKENAEDLEFYLPEFKIKDYEAPPLPEYKLPEYQASFVSVYNLS